jgi:hypothetical protein
MTIPDESREALLRLIWPDAPDEFDLGHAMAVQHVIAAGWTSPGAAPEVTPLAMEIARRSDEIETMSAEKGLPSLSGSVLKPPLYQPVGAGSLKTRLASALAALDEAREALEPFAQWGRFDDDRPDGNRVTSYGLAGSHRAALRALARIDAIREAETK